MLTGRSVCGSVYSYSPDQEKPDLPKVVQNAGVTYSGPGVIDVKQNSFGVKKLPITYDQAANEERITQLHDSKHWFAGMIMYIWRKLNPALGKKKVAKVKKEQTMVQEQTVEKKEVS